MNKSVSFSCNYKKKIAFLPVVALIAIIITQVAISVFYINQKSGFHIDEFYSHTQANGRLLRGQAHRDWEIYNQWHSSAFFNNYLTVQEGERFDFIPVYHTLSRNIHPPFFHMQLHAASSLFPNLFSKWIGTTINIIWLSAATVLLYLTAKIVLKNNYLALLPSLIWGLSSGAISIVLFIRMYAILTFFFVAIMYLGVLIINGNHKFYYKADKCVSSEKDNSLIEKTKKKFYIFLGLTFFFGFFTHFYFIIFFALVAVMILFWLIYKKDIIQIRNCIIVILISFLVYIAAWPNVFHRIFVSSRGRESFYSAVNFDDTQNRLYEFSKLFLNEDALPRQLSLIVFAFLIIFGVGIVLLVKRKVHIKNILEPHNYLVLFIAVCTVSYYLIVAQIAPIKCARYHYAIYPSVMLLLVSILHHIMIYMYSIKTRYTSIILTIICLFVVFAGFSNRQVSHLYPDVPDVSSIIQELDSPVCIYLFTDRLLYFELLLYDFTLFENTFICRETSNNDIFHYFRTALHGIERGEDLIIYISSEMDYEFLNHVHDILYEYFYIEGIQIFYTSQGFRSYDAYKVIW